MPLTLINHSPNTIRIPVCTPLCQLMIVALGEPSEADYAARTDRKYLNDIGGPSYWWRDKLLREIREAVSNTNLPKNVFDELDELLVSWDDVEVLERLEEFVSDAKHGGFGNADELLDAFSKVEDRKDASAKRIDFAGQWSWALLSSIAIGVALFSVPGAVKVLLGMVAALSIVVALASIGRSRPDYLTTTRLMTLRSRRDSSRLNP